MCNNVQWPCGVGFQVPNSAPSWLSVSFEKRVVLLSVNHKDRVVGGDRNMDHNTKAGVNNLDKLIFKPDTHTPEVPPEVRVQTLDPEGVLGTCIACCQTGCQA